MFLREKLVVDLALKPVSPISERVRSDALLFCVKPRSKMILTGVQDDLAMESSRRAEHC